MRNVHDVLPENERDDPGAQTRRVARAYANLFSGAGSSEDADLVLVDLALYTRYYVTAPLDMPGDQVKALDQRRSVLNRILSALALTGVGADGLLEAAASAPPLDDEEIIG